MRRILLWLQRLFRHDQQVIEMKDNMMVILSRPRRSKEVRK